MDDWTRQAEAELDRYHEQMLRQLEAEELKCFLAKASPAELRAFYGPRWRQAMTPTDPAPQPPVPPAPESSAEPPADPAAEPHSPAPSPKRTTSPRPPKKRAPGCSRLAPHRVQFLRAGLLPSSVRLSP